VRYTGVLTARCAINRDDVRRPPRSGSLHRREGIRTLDGVSLTINAVEDAVDEVRFDVNLVPHTLSVTSLGSLKQGEAVHLEVDLVARYLKRLMDAQRPLQDA
jgi:riboflavin synthase